MRPNAETVCPICHSTIYVSYVLLGAISSCPFCDERIVPRVPIGTGYPKTGFQITFRDFQLLVSSGDVADLLLEWYGYTAIDNGYAWFVKSPKGNKIDLVELHLRIQKDPVKQKSLYRAAMAVWR